ncbi:MAG: cation diffusion facilitator family transporter [Ruminococcus sp.]|nr:cation diffusion facilitator family transporter [Ruminococcus sp.]
MKREKGVINICSVAAALNLLLFFVKLYVSLSTNSISIFSDAINNMADSLSCIVSVVCMVVSIRLAKKGTAYLCGKIEQLLSLGLAVIVAVVGCSFAYSSLERFMYPTPIWFTMKYFSMIAMTAAVKLIMFFVFRFEAKKNNSAVIKVMQADSLMDFFVTTVTLVSFAAAQYTDFMIDAFAGLIISVIIIVSAIRLIKANLFGVINFVPESLREAVEQAAFSMNGCEIRRITYSVESERETIAYVSAEFGNDMNAEQMKNEVDSLKKSCEDAGVNVQVIIN